MSVFMVLSLGMLAAAPTGAQTTGSTTANTSANTTETSVATTVGGSGGGVGGTTLAHTGTNSALPLELAGGLITATLAGIGLLKKTRQS
jgi:hypothetical protein